MTISPIRSELLKYMEDKELPIWQEQRRDFIGNFLQTLPASERTVNKRRSTRACLDTILNLMNVGIDPSLERRGKNKKKRTNIDTSKTLTKSR